MRGYIGKSTRGQRFRDWAVVWGFRIGCPAILLLLVAAIILIAAIEEPCEVIESQDEAYKCSAAVAVRMLRTDEGNLVPNYNDCLLSGWPRACFEDKIPLLDGHRWDQEDGEYQCLEIKYKSARVNSLEPNLFDLVIEDSFDPSQCRWSCDPVADERCKK